MSLSPESGQIEVTPPPPQQPWSRVKKSLGPLAGAGIVIAKFFAQLKFFILPLLKFLPIILKTGGSMIFSIWFYAMIFGWRFAIGFILLLFVHECGHLLVARRLGLKVSAPFFIPLFGALILLKEQPRDAWTEARIGIGGPMLGGLGALACHYIGQTFDMPLLIGLATFGYFLNLFNLLPVGFLDGGRIVTAVSRWLWLPGMVLLGWIGLTRGNLVVWLVILYSIPRVLSLFRKRDPEEARYYEVTSTQRWTMSLLYFGLIAILAVGQHIGHQQLLDRGVGWQPSKRPQPVYQ